MRPIYSATASLAACLALSACATVNSSPMASHRDPAVPPPGVPPHVGQRYDAGAQDITAQAGIAYFLPRQLVKVVVSRKSNALTAAIDKFAEAKLAASSAKSKLSDAEAAVTSAENAIVENKDSPEALAILRPRLATLKTARDKAKKDADDADAAVIKARGDLEAARSVKTDPDPAKAMLQAFAEALKGKTPAAAAAAPAKPADSFKVTVALTLEAPTADPRAGFRLDPRHSILRDDKHKLSLTGEGLISSADAVAVDRTGQIIVELATFAGAIATGTPSTFKIQKSHAGNYEAQIVQPPEPKPCENYPDSVTALVDLTSPAEVNALNARIACLGAQLAVRNDGPIGGLLPGRNNLAVPVDGVAYRIPRSVYVDVGTCTLAIEACLAKTDGGLALQSSNWFTAQTVSVSLPQAGPTSFIRQNAGFATRTHYGLTFKDGILQEYEGDRPSEALEVASMPMKVLNGVFAGASQIISLRTGVANKSKEYIDSQKGIEEAKNNLAAAALTGDKTMFDNQLAVLKAQLALQSGELDGQKSVASSQLELAKALAELQAQGITLPATVSTNQLNATLTMMRNEAKLQAANKCIAEKIAAGLDYQVCLN